MCTVSFVNSNNQIIITSNRDEQTERPLAIEPKSYSINNKIVIFPKDSKVGGTWFATDENGTVLVLLNGASEKHIPEKSYKKSRGLIVLDLISNVSPKEFWEILDLENIEPFTIILFENQMLYQLRWNGYLKEKSILDANKNYIWSSSTLYDKEMRSQRSEWFHEYLQNKTSISDAQMIDFHKNTQKENQENGLIINRNNKLKTVSITQSILQKNKVGILYFDLVSNKDFSTSFIKI